METRMSRFTCDGCKAAVDVAEGSNETPYKHDWVEIQFFSAAKNGRVHLCHDCQRSETVADVLEKGKPLS